MSKTLLMTNCKRCGKGNAVRLVHNLVYDNWYVMCGKCRSCGKTDVDADRAIIEWNLMNEGGD